MGRLIWVVGVGVLAAGLGGCGDPELNGFGDTVTTYAMYGYPFDARGQHTEGPKYLLSETTEIGTSDRSREATLGLAVAQLLDDHLTPGLDNFWAGVCAPGQVVEDVELRPHLVTVRTVDKVPSHETCDLTASERAVRRQQLAWTVTHHLDPFGEQEPPVVRLIEANGDTWDVVADPSYLEPRDRPTPSATDPVAHSARVGPAVAHGHIEALPGAVEPVLAHLGELLATLPQRQ